MANYVERDGDWVWRPTGALERTKMFLFPFIVDKAAIQKLCDDFVNDPSNDAVKAEPWSSPIPLPGEPTFVLLVCADIEKAYSQHPVDITKGFMDERDMGFFVPIKFTDKSNVQSTAMLLPYLFVDNLPALLIGREIFGFPKLLGDIQIMDDPPFAEVISTALPVYGPDRCAVKRPILQLRTLNPAASQLCVPGPVIEVARILMTFVLWLLGIVPPLNGFTQIPMVFLKQFRDVHTDGKACYQSVTRAIGTIGAIRRACLHTDDFELTVFSHDSIDIATTLGFGGGTTFATSIGVSIDMDFTLPLGKTEWEAP